MSNIQKLAETGNTNHKLFAATVTSLMKSQGVYGRLFNTVNELDDENYHALYKQIEKQNFKDTLDVVFWLEC